MLLSDSSLWIVGLLLLFSALVCCVWWKHARDSLPFSSALLDMAVEVQKKYLSVLALWLCVVFVHLVLAMWWGAVFVNILKVGVTPVDVI